MTTNLGSRVIERESPILSKEDVRFGLKAAPTLESQRQKIELLVNPDGTFSLKPPVKREVTAEDEQKFVKITGLVMEELKKFFRPEFLNRIDDIIVFNHLSKHDIWEICGLMLNQLTKRIKEQGAILKIDNAVRFFLTEEGYDPIYGARPLRRSITKFLEDKLAEACLSNVLHEGTVINVTQKIKPNIYGNRPIYSPVFDDIYTSEISVEFDYSNVDFIELQKNEKQENIIETNVK
jgi:ATP-dependent Clp protease ATP-binding subunit ClpA